LFLRVCQMGSPTTLDRCTTNLGNPYFRDPTANPIFVLPWNCTILSTASNQHLIRLKKCR